MGEFGRRGGEFAGGMEARERSARERGIERDNIENRLRSIGAKTKELKEKKIRKHDENDELQRLEQEKEDLEKRLEVIRQEEETEAGRRARGL